MRGGWCILGPASDAGHGVFIQLRGELRALGYLGNLAVDIHTIN